MARGRRAGAAGRSTPVRSMVVWCPDWPVVAMARAEGVAEDAVLAADEFLAVIEKGLVYACSAAARADGVRRGLRIREAQARSPRLRVFELDTAVVNRAFEPVIMALEELSPGVQVVRPGTCALRARGPARFYGDEEGAAVAFLARLAEIGVTDARIGIADGLFAADHAARLPGRELVRIVPPGGSGDFLAPLPVGFLGGLEGADELIPLLGRLGIHSLGEFARLPLEDVQSRFGDDGARAHLKASGRDGQPVVPRIPPEVRESVSEFEPPLDRIDQVTFGIRAAADLFVQRLSESRLVCTGIRVELTSERGQVRERSWLHPRWFSSSDVVDRVRWQLQGGDAIETALESGISRVRVIAEAVDASAKHETGLWGSGSEERVHHGMARLQSMVGHEGVLTATIGGGRAPGERIRFAPWGDRVEASGAGAPWPGSLPPPLPSTVFEQPRVVQVATAEGEPVEVSARGELSAAPALFSETGALHDLRPLSAWAGPWPTEERWWDATAHRRVDRFQVVDDCGGAWLLALENHRWRAEARYD
ncbi:DNA polymerase Y family protein [Herbiconiux sp. CPCC 203407]|uniref:DNA polymerase Y family protein n=1 Tax=Herbiconiux oxytropis TaxID=2970915 RepID=A0AA42BTK7_9MICO|nr:DNA polymerase Y family protein [Herbiconiux oxytropis]MCS5720389.1 DNA polymerase Y family protein [Herbiconiux oxytropis]MCS5725962.1 DNA polymerase Y family protein [Herbiconiux oxytropis]